jgi:phosphoglycerol transferase MdoB-like AlkP superfamily enzyme
MSRTSNSFVSAFILLIALVGFVAAMSSGEYRLALASVTGGLFLWLAFLSVAKLKYGALPLVVTISGLLVGVSLFMDSTVEQNLWGGYQVQPDAALFSFVLLLIAMTPGLLLFYFRTIDSVKPSFATPVATPNQAVPVSSTPEAQGMESKQLDAWNPEDYEIEYDPELIAAYYGAYEEGEEEE